MVQLPETVEDLVRLIGETEAIKLMQLHPKLTVRIPRNPERATLLLQALKQPSVEALCHYYDGERLYIPDAANLLRIYRDEAIREKFQTASTYELAREYGLSYRRVQQIVAAGNQSRPRVDENQGELF